MVLPVLILPALIRMEDQSCSIRYSFKCLLQHGSIRMEDQSCSIRYSFKCLLQHGSYHAQYRPVGNGVADQITVVQIQNRREIQLGSSPNQFCQFRPTTSPPAIKSKTTAAAMTICFFCITTLPLLLDLFIYVHPPVLRPVRNTLGNIKNFSISLICV